MNKKYFILILLTVNIIISLAFPTLAAENKEIVVLDTCDNGDAFAHLPVDYKDKIEGSGSVVAKGTPVVQFTQTFNKSIDPKIPEENAFFEFWIYVEDPKYLTNEGQIELNSSGVVDTEEFTWYLFNEDIITGWNFISLSFKDAEKTGNPNIHDLKMMRIYQFTTKITYLKLDNVYITNQKTEVDKKMLGVKATVSSLEGNSNANFIVWKGFGPENKQTPTFYIIGIIVSLSLMVIAIMSTIFILRKHRKKSTDNISIDD